MIKETNCCSFFIKLCGRMCKVNRRESIKPDKKNTVVEIIGEFNNEEGKDNICNGKTKIGKSNIVTGNRNNPMINSSAGYVNSCNAQSTMSNRKNSKVASDSPGLFYDQSLITENPNKESVLHNLDEAFKIMQSIDDQASENYSENPPSPDKFSKVLKNINFKAIMSENN
ncbi:hypothetical protein SteCoe_30775 [Stentor coeruleus]|uniref:Uncharacterized protein n=1 Tax=Stentor coeruleus TaxID=5963 RepID=A0A1R2B2Y0_9CILI|nr:hypothetical protein SteCoe_30775 [Stentor coeruleus]